MDGKKGRPKKNPRMRMDTDLRIPVTAEQKQLVMAAAADEPAGFAAWARSVLLQAALDKAEKAKRAGSPL